MKHVLALFLSIVALTVHAQVLYIDQPFTDTIACSDDQMYLRFTVGNSNFFQPGNVFTAQLSNANGSFTSPVNVGSLTSTTSGQIPFAFPLNTPGGNGYRIRIVSSNPQVVSQDDGVNISCYATPSGYVTSSYHPGAVYILKTVFYSDTVCAGSSVTYTANIANVASAIFDWFYFGTYSTGNTCTLYNIVNSQSLNCDVGTTDFCGGNNISLPFRMHITVIPQVPSNITVTPSINGPICAQTPVIFNATMTNGGTTPAYQWEKNGSAIPGATTTLYTDINLQPGDVIACTGTSSLQCSVPTVSTPIALTIYPRPDTTVIVSGPVDLCNTDSLVLQAPVGSSYQWQLNGANIPGATSPTYMVHRTGNYTA